MAAFRRGTREGAEDVRRLSTASKDAQAEVAKLGQAAGKAADEVVASAKRAADGFTRDAAGRLRDARSRFIREGEQLGGALGEGVRRGSASSRAGLDDMLPSVTRLVSGARALSTVTAVAGGTVAALQGIPPLLTAIGGGLGALPALAAGAGLSMGTLKLGLSGVGDAIDQVFEPPKDETPFDRLSDSAGRFVVQVGRLKPELLELRRFGHESVFVGLDEELDDFASVTLPFARTQVERFGATWNATFRELLRLGRRPEFLAGLDVAATSADRFFDKVNARIPPTGRALGQLFQSSGVFVDRFGDSLLDYVDEFNMWIGRVESSGDLDRFFADAADSADALLDIGREVFRLIGSISSVDPGADLFRDAADALARFNDEAHNTRDLQSIIASGNTAVRGLIDVMLVLGDAAADMFADPGTTAAIAAYFDVLKSAAQIVSGVVQALGLLPDGVQAAVLAGVALAVTYGKLKGVFGGVMDATSRLNDRLSQIGPTGERAGRGLQNVTVWAGRAAGAFLALQAAQAVLAAVQDDLNPQIEALSRSLADFGRDGKIAGEAARVLGEDMEDLNVGLKFLADTDNSRRQFARWGQDLLETVVPGLDGTNTSLTRTRERVTAMDQALADLVASGDTEAAAAAFRRLAEAHAAEGVSVEELTALFPQYQAALDEAARTADPIAVAERKVSENADLMGQSWEDAARSGRSLTDVFNQLNGEAIGWAQAELDADEAARRLKEALDESNGSLDTHTAEGAAAKQALLDFAVATAAAAQAKLEESGSLEEANAVYQAYRRQLVETLTQMTGNRNEAERLADQYLKMPKEIKTKATPENFNFAISKAKELDNKISGLDGRVVDITFRYGYQGDARAFKNRWGGVYDHARFGGVWRHAAAGVLRDAAMFSTRNPARYAFAEPATGGEAFIPRRGDYNRSLSIWEHVGREWLGVLPPKRSWSVPQMMPSTQRVEVTVRQDGAAGLRPQELAAAVRAALVGVSVQMDGHAVGYVQGRQADIMSRA